MHHWFGACFHFPSPPFFFNTRCHGVVLSADQSTARKWAPGTLPGAGAIASCSLRGRMRQTNHLNAREAQVPLLRRASVSDVAGARHAPSWHSGVPLWGVWGHRAECEAGFPGGKGVGQESGRGAVPDPAGLDLHVVWSADFPWVCSRPGPQVSPAPPYRNVS